MTTLIVGAVTYLAVATVIASALGHWIRSRT